MHFGWTISRNVTSASGSVTFLVCIKSVDKSGDEQEHWNSERCSDISVAPGLETGEPIEEKYPDVLNQLSDKVENISKSNVTINDEESSATSTYSSNKINTLVGGKADSTTVTQLNSKVGSLETTIGTKADTSTVNRLSSDISELEETVTGLSGDLTALETQVSDIPSINDEAASATSVYSSNKVDDLVEDVDTKVSSKADQSALTALQSTVGTKADTATVTELSSKVDSLEETVGTKAGINDSQASATSTYSSNKINTIVGGKADTATVTELSSKVDSLEETVGTKAGINDSQASATSTYSSNKINTIVGGKADTATVTELSSKVDSLEETVGTKAAQTELDTLEETVSTLQTTVSSKADQSALTALQTTVGAKAAQTDLDSLEGTVSSLQTTVNNKADKSTVNAKLNKPTVKTITINTGNWFSGVYTLSDSLITATSIQEWCLPVYTGSNTAEINALQAANIVDAGQSAGQAKIRCLGTVPTVTVHMVVIFWG